MELWLYLWSISGNVQTLFVVCGIVLSVGGMFMFVEMSEFEESPEFSWTILIPMLGVTMLLLSALIPCKKDIAMIYIVPKIANSDIIQKDVPEMYDLAKDRIKELISDGEKTGGKSESR